LCFPFLPLLSSSLRRDLCKEWLLDLTFLSYLHVVGGNDDNVALLRRRHRCHHHHLLMPKEKLSVANEGRNLGSEPKRPKKKNGLREVEGQEE